jgi:hypothetical protein
MVNDKFPFLCFFYSIRLHLNISRASYLNLINYCLLAGFATVVGMVIFAYYHECDILKSDIIDHYEQVNDKLDFLFFYCNFINCQSFLIKDTSPFGDG